MQEPQQRVGSSAQGGVEAGLKGGESGAIDGGGGGDEAPVEEVTVEHGVEIPEGDVIVEAGGADGIPTGEDAAELPAGGDGGGGR